MLTADQRSHPTFTHYTNLSSSHAFFVVSIVDLVRSEEHWVIPVTVKQQIHIACATFSCRLACTIQTDRFKEMYAHSESFKQIGKSRKDGWVFRTNFNGFKDQRDDKVT